MDVSENRGFSSKSSILIGFSIICTIHLGVSLFLETPIYVGLVEGIPLPTSKTQWEDQFYWDHDPHTYIVATLFFSQERCSCNSLWRHIKDAVDNFVRDHWLVNTLRLVPGGIFSRQKNSRFVCVFFGYLPQKRMFIMFFSEIFNGWMKDVFPIELVPFFGDTR